MTQEPAKWTFELSRVPRSAKVQFEIKTESGDRVAISDPMADLTSAMNAIDFIKRFAVDFEVRSFPG